MTLDIIREVQTRLGITSDGIAGPITWNAILKAVGGEHTTEQPIDRLDDRSEENIAGLLPVVQELARELIQALSARGITAKVISGYRTYAEQNDLYEQGRTKPGNIVTNARGGYSNHNFRLAFDLGIFDGSKYLPESHLYGEAGIIGKGIGLLWGGDWENEDQPHFEFRPEWARDLSESQALAEYRARFSRGETIV